MHPIGHELKRLKLNDNGSGNGSTLPVRIAIAQNGRVRDFIEALKSIEERIRSWSKN